MKLLNHNSIERANNNNIGIYIMYINMRYKYRNYKHLSIFILKL